MALYTRVTGTAAGYVVVSLRKNGQAKTKFVHRLVCLAFLGTGADAQVNHKDGNKANNFLENLEWATRSRNQKHRYTHLRQDGTQKGKFGKDNPSSKVFKVVFPDGSTEIVKGLHQFCKEYHLSTGMMSEVASGKRSHHKGFKCESIIKSGVDPA